MIIAILFACDSSLDPVMDFKIGKNRYIRKVDGDEREYYVHVPADYDPDKATPLVFMLHAASSRGETAYKISGWTKLGMDETVYGSLIRAT